MAEKLQYDGHTAIVGCDADLEPTLLPRTLAAKAVNRAFRGGRNRTRPPFRQIGILFDDESDRVPFLSGNFQGARFYYKCRPARYDGIVCSVAGTIYFLKLAGNTATVFKLMEGNDPNLMHTFFVQAEDWIYIQNGADLPIFWDGQLPSTARRSLGPSESEMPIGTLMEYAHGRVFVSNAFNQIAASDIIFGAGFTDTTNTQKFTENTYFAEGGYFSTPANLGAITGMTVLPVQDVNLRGQGELIVMCKNGGFTMDVSLPRAQWNSQNIQRTAVIGRGNQSPWSLVVVNGDLWYRSSDGIATLTNSRLDFDRKTAYRKFSREVNPWLTGDSRNRQQFASMVFFDNRLICTVRPIQNGSHRYHLGMVVLDLDTTSGSKGIGEAVNWDGLWTGPKVTQFVNSGDRAFAFAFDNQNQLFELVSDQADDLVDGKRVPIKSFYITAPFDFSIGQTSTAFNDKNLLGGDLWISRITDNVTIEARFRPLHNPKWSELLPESELELKVPPELVNENLGYTYPLARHIVFNTPDQDECDETSDHPAAVSSQFQVGVFMSGEIQVDKLRLKASENLSDSSDRANVEPFAPLQTQTEDDFEAVYGQH